MIYLQIQEIPLAFDFLIAIAIGIVVWLLCYFWIFRKKSIISSIISIIIGILYIGYIHQFSYYRINSESTESFVDTIPFSQDKTQIIQKQTEDLASENDIEVDTLFYDSDIPNYDLEAKNYFNDNKDSVSKINNKFTIAPSMFEESPGLLLLIYHSRSMKENSEKQSWYNLYPLMKDEQIKKLYNILIREDKKHMFIDKKYEKKKLQIKNKYLSNWDSMQNSKK